MANTIGGGAPWKYSELLNNCLQILLTIGLGLLLGHCKIFRADTFSPHAVSFVFRVALPALVIRGLGIVIDLRSVGLWKYIGAFLLLRGMALVLAFGTIVGGALLGPDNKTHHYGIGHVAVVWLSLTWISTVIIGSVVVDFKYGLLAGVSSFIFQSPIQLLLLECHLLEQEYLESQRNERRRISHRDEEGGNAQEEENCMRHDGDDDDEHTQEETLPMETTPAKENMDDANNSSNSNNDQIENNNDSELHVASLWLDFLTRGSVWRKILVKWLSNPIIWSILAGFFLTLTKLGPRFLNPKSDEYVPGLGWFFAICKWLGDIVSPLSLFTMGVWMRSRGRNIMFQIPTWMALLCLVSKLVVVPLIMVGLATALHLDNESGRAAVLIAALPISMASFSLASHYKIGTALLSENVALGTLLMLPTILLWTYAMDEIGIFVTDG